MDFVDIFGLLAQNDVETQSLSEYIAELSLLQSDLGRYPSSCVAAASVLIARLTKKKGNLVFLIDLKL